jgi:hypothetical protein
MGQKKAAKDLTGYRVPNGKLTVVGLADGEEFKGAKRSKWKCRCDCGSMVVILGSDLLQGETLSCGCYRKQMAVKKLPNAHANRGETGETVLAMLSGTEPFSSGTSGHRGVSWNKPLGKYTAQITFKRKKYHLGTFDSPEEAHEAYLKAKEELHLGCLQEHPEYLEKVKESKREH